MTCDELETFFNTFGGGGKPIGGAHENFGVGSKTSLLPWNQYGVVVISWVNGDPSMIWVTRDPATGDYGLKQEYTERGLEPVYDPYDDPDHGSDWSAVKPDWIEDHGTVIILMGNESSTDTVLGDPNRAESDIKGISSFLNRRMWVLKEGVEVYVDELRHTDRSSWPTSEAIAHGPTPKSGKDRRTNRRRIEGACNYILYPDRRSNHGRLGAQGTVRLRDAIEIDWFLWEGERPQVHPYAAEIGFIATLYKDELYDVTSHHSVYRSFGVSESSVRSRLWLIIRPPVDPEDRHGVYPKTDRNSLLIMGGPSAGEPLPINEWAGEFADNMPDELLAALKSARQGSSGTITDPEWREKLAERFGARWRIARLRARQAGSLLLSQLPDGTTVPIRKAKVSPPLVHTDKPESHGGRGSPRVRPRTPLGARLLEKPDGTTEGARVQTNGGLPTYRAVAAADITEGMLAAWAPHDPECPEGVVLINVDHPVLQSVIEHWQSQFADHHAEAVCKDVIDIYGQVAVSKIAHSEHLKGQLPSRTVDDELRSESALTMALLGLMAEHHLIATRLGGKYNRRRLPVANKRRADRVQSPRSVEISSEPREETVDDE